MALDSDSLQNLIDRPTESLFIELKGWISPNTPEGVGKIVTAAIAMRNNNGGYILIGFNNITGKPCTDNIPSDVRKLFHQDEIQRMISKYSSELFEAKVHFPIRDDVEFPVIEISPGVKTPVATKKPLKNDEGKTLFRENKVFIRSLESNNTPSTTEATCRDWPHIVEVCFDNREADIGHFIRRHLRTLSPELVRTFSSLIPQTESGKTGEVPRSQLEEPVTLPPIDEKTTEPMALKYLQEGATRYNTIVKERNLSLPAHGSWEVSAIILGTVPTYSADRSFLNLLFSSNPKYTAWPAWLDSRGSNEKEDRPHIFEKAWEAFICNLSTDWGGKDLDLSGHISLQ